MHSIDNKANKKPNFWTLHLSGWLAYIVIFSFDNILFTHETDASWAVIFPLFLSASMALLLTLPLRHIYRDCWSSTPSNLILIIACASLVVALIWTPSKNLTMWYFNKDMSIVDWFAAFNNEEQNPWAILTGLSYSFFMILVWSSLYFGINYHYRLMQEKQLHIDAVRLSHQAQIKMLRYQINPHFLFNTLNAISTLVLSEHTAKANGMLIRLSTFLRFSLDNDPEKKVALYEEIKASMLYLEIEKTRFEERLKVDIRISEEAENVLVPSLILQPLIENSIKYAIAKMTSDGLICIEAATKQGLLHLSVFDNGPGQTPIPTTTTTTSPEQTKHKGVGINNIKDRLNVLYPGEHKFTIHAAPEQGFKVHIIIPVEHA
ncbi:histidine kinase [Glaciecola sp. MH2013]|uniref:sensor histidine kinase n=1 Tax=Glaciecola sp. MH2013 TaxID=2785524 RepID=UPI00189E492A|nr:histidine kinase [Glaciecola sp. MH2013]MBF7074668.1 histidine kinase [Glaciecola sp. MH2013]